MQRLQNYATPPMDRGFEGFDLLTNLTEDIPGFWGTIDPVLTSEFLPLPQEDTPPLATPLVGNYLLEGNSMSPNFNDPFFPSTPVLDEFISPQDIAILYCDPPLTSAKVKRTKQVCLDTVIISIFSTLYYLL